MKSYLSSKGFLVTDDTSLPNVSRFYVNDLFGNRIEFIQD
jgi:hypothetical protein